MLTVIVALCGMMPWTVIIFSCFPPLVVDLARLVNWYNFPQVVSSLANPSPGSKTRLMVIFPDGLELGWVSWLTRP